MQVRKRVAATGLLAVAAAALLLGPPWLEGRLRARLERTASRHGLAASFESVRLGLRRTLTLEGVRIERPGAFSLAVDRVELSWRPLGSRLAGGWRVALGRVSVVGRGGVVLEVVPTLWALDPASPAGWRAELQAPARGIFASWLPARGGDRVEWSAEALPARGLLALRHAGAPLVDAGSLSGHGLFVRTAQGAGFAARIDGLGVRLAALGAPGEASFGLPTDVGVAFEGSWRRDGSSLQLRHWAAALGGATLHGTLSLDDLREDPRLQLSLDVRRLEFARLLGTSGVVQPIAGGPGRESAAGALGWASLQARADGRLGDPRSFSVAQRLDFTPPRVLPPELLRLRSDFVHEVALRSGERRAILVSTDSPDFIALRDVPPLLVRTLLLAEDAGFYGHHGVDLAELPSALLTNWARGGPFRGASTLTQQLAKNLFLTREKRLGRKLQELSLALLLEATLDKQRMLEIYLNVIEWGPDLYGLRPAARHYFGAEPAALTPAQTAFLVSLIPGPVKYQRALADGVPAPWFRTLVDNLLAKLRSVDALGEDEYLAALEERLELAPPPAPAPEPQS